MWEAAETSLKVKRDVVLLVGKPQLSSEALGFYTDVSNKMENYK